VTNRSHVHVRLRTIKLFLRHARFPSLKISLQSSILSLQFFPGPLITSFN
jgi:hypothetical protein